MTSTSFGLYARKSPMSRSLVTMSEAPSSQYAWQR